MKIIRRIRNRVKCEYYRKLLESTLIEARKTNSARIYNRLMDVAEYYGDLVSIYSIKSKY